MLRKFLLASVALMLCTRSVFTGMALRISGHSSPAMRAFHELAEQIRHLGARICLGLAYPEYLLVLLGSDVRLAISRPTIPHSGIHFACQHAVHLVLGR